MAGGSLDRILWDRVAMPLQWGAALQIILDIVEGKTPATLQRILPVNNYMSSQLITLSKSQVICIFPMQV